MGCPSLALSWKMLLVQPESLGYVKGEAGACVSACSELLGADLPLGQFSRVSTKNLPPLTLPCCVPGYWEQYSTSLCGWLRVQHVGSAMLAATRENSSTLCYGCGSPVWQ